MSIEYIGTYKIQAPEKAPLTFEDGLAMAENVIRPITTAFVDGQAKILFLIPETRETYMKGGRGPFSIPPAFYVGLLEELLETTRDRYFPDLKPQARRDRIRLTGGADYQEPDALAVIERLFHTSWVTYDPLEQFLGNKIQIGILLQDGTITIAQYEAPRLMAQSGNKRTNHSLLAFGIKYFKALDFMFSMNLTARHSYNADNPQADTTAAPSADFA